ncbi:putative manganese catalase [Deinococcus carri]|uniref:Manganese catalase n=1 Tax=Deinococcus carri TaxID=1211323 RepID=A0ABP9W4A5_9DEIO
MFYFDKQTQYPVRVEKPNPLFAKMLQQALGGIEGEMRVMLQYLFQAWNSRGPSKYRDMLLHTGTEEIGHVEMYATAIALNLEGSPDVVKEEAARQNPMVAAVMGGMSPRAYLSGGMGALAADSEGNPFNGSWVVASGNIAANMYSNVNAESSGLVLACRLYDMTDDPGMKEMLRFLISRDVMHQQQWLAVIEELGGYPGVLPIPNSFPHDEEHETREFAYTFFTTNADGSPPPQGRWTSGPSLDGRGEFNVKHLQPMGEEPQLAPPMPSTFPEVQELEGGQQRVAQAGYTSGRGADASSTSSEGIATRIKDSLKNVAEELRGGNDREER